MLNIDTRRALRSPGELKALVDAVLAAGAADEGDAIEWKAGSVDLAEKSGFVHVVRSIIGFANRDSIIADRAFEGCAYLVVGAAPGELSGVAELDLADLDNKMRAYLGYPHPIWSADWVREDGKAVLIVSVEAPRAGDEMWALAKDLGKYGAGTVWVRHASKTEPATADDIRRLTRRYAELAAQVELTVEFRDDPFAAAVVDLSDESFDEWLEVEKRVRLESLEVYQRRQRQRPAFGAFDVVGAMQGENRKPEDYRRAVDSYIEEVRAQLRDVTLAQACNIAPRLRLAVRNSTERNFAEVRVDVEVDGPAIAFDVVDMPRLPRPPDAYGTSLLLRMGTSLDIADLVRHAPDARPTVKVFNHGRSFRFPEVHLRPRGRTTLAPALVVAGSTPGEIRLSWSATASNSNGVARGVLDVEISDRVITAAHAMAQLDSSRSH